MEHGCTLYARISGSNPQTGEIIDTYDCSLTIIPMLLVENAQQSRQTGSAVESFRNEMVKANEQSVRLLAAAQQNLLSK